MVTKGGKGKGMPVGKGMGSLISKMSPSKSKKKNSTEAPKSPAKGKTITNSLKGMFKGQGESPAKAPPAKSPARKKMTNSLKGMFKRKGKNPVENESDRPVNTVNTKPNGKYAPNSPSMPPSQLQSRRQSSSPPSPAPPPPHPPRRQKSVPSFSSDQTTNMRQNDTDIPYIDIDLNRSIDSSKSKDAKQLYMKFLLRSGKFDESSPYYSILKDVDQHTMRDIVNKAEKYVTIDKKGMRALTKQKR